MLNLIAGQSPLLLIAAPALFALLLGGFVLLAVFMGRGHGKLRADLQRVFEQLDLTRGELRSHADLIERLDSRTKVRDLGTSNTRAFDAAVKMARSGASFDHLAANSGLTKQEARLLARLHSPERAVADKARA